MLERLKPQPEDKILGLMVKYREDPRSDLKVDLGVGVYKNAEGKTPVMRAVKEAERRLLEAQDSKSYVGLLGNLDFVAGIRDLVLGDTVATNRVVGMQGVGGTGAIRQLFELIRLANPAATVWISDPSWPNHEAILKFMGVPYNKYRYFDDETCEVDFAGMLASLEAAAAGDVVLLHGCCHNPTGANITLEQWAQVTDLLLAKGLVPMVDIAYQGFGDGLEEDAAGVRLMASRVPQMLIAASCSKNFGVYRDRVGAALAIAEKPEQIDVIKGNLQSINRVNFSFPPDHGATVVSIILSDPELLADWKAELEDMRLGMLDLRTGLAEELRRATNSDRFDFVADHRGMFSRLGLTPEQVTRLRDEFAIYAVGDSRVNIAGLPGDRLDYLAKAIAAVIE